MNKKNIIISEGERPFWQLAIAAVFYTCALICLYLFFSRIDLYAPSKQVRGAASLLEVGIILFIGGMGFSGVKDIHFDFQNRRYKEVYGVGPFKFGKWKRFHALKYVAVFKNTKGEFEVNLWYDRNKHFNISLFPDVSGAITEAKALARQIGLDLYDSTVPNKGKWIQLTDGD